LEKWGILNAALQQWREIVLWDQKAESVKLKAKS